MDKKQFCDKHGITERQFSGEVEITGSLYLRSLTSIPDGFNPTVGGSLILNSLTSIPDGFNPTVGGSLILRSLTSIPDGFNPTVGGSLYLNSGLRAETNQPARVLEWDAKFCIADGIFAEILSTRIVGEFLVRRVRKVHKEEIFYLVESGENVAHGNTVAMAVADLRFKAEDRDVSDYKDLSLDSVLTLEDSIICYRVLTGACNFGVNDFLANRHKPALKKSYKVSELIEATKGEYNADRFAQFFQR